jgi:hypothetical protein
VEDPATNDDQEIAATPRRLRWSPLLRAKDDLMV